MDEHLFPPPDPGPGAPGQLLLDGPDGPHALGPPTVDSDADGRPDTVLADTPGGLLLATDLDADAHADVATVVGGALPPPEWDPGWDAPAPPAPVLDPVSGHWAGLA